MENHEEHDREAKERIVSDVKEYGCHLALLETDGYSPAFVYSIGLYKNFDHPEIILFGLPVETMGHIINGLKDEISQGKAYQSGEYYDGVLDGFQIQFLDVNEDNYPDYLGYAGWFYDYSFNFPTLQLIWPDKEANWPWEEDFNSHWKFKQPLLDRNMDFKFLESKNLGVYTTSFALEGHPILHVYHNEDGDWQFFTEHGAILEESKLVSLQSLVKMDPTLNELHHMNFGAEAHRESEDAEWVITEDEV